MRKETTNKPKKEPFLILTRTKFENKSRRRITNILKEKFPGKFQRSEEHTNKKIPTKHQKPNIKKMNTTRKYPPPSVFYKIVNKNNNASKKTRERGTKGPMTRPHA